MAKASLGGGSSLPATVELLQQSLGQTIERLGRCEPTNDVRTLRIEAIRLRGVINKWRSRSPEPDAYDEMLHRVLHLAAAAGAMPELDKGAEPEEKSLVGEAEAPPDSLDFEPRLYSLGPTVTRQKTLPDEREREAFEGAEGSIEPAPVSKRAARITLTNEAEAPPISQRTPSLPQARAQLDSISSEGPPSVRPYRPPLDSVLKEPSEEAGALRIPIEVVPVTLGENRDPNFVLLSDTYSPRADVYRALRRKLAALPTRPRCIALTSPEPGEGKTTAAVNLALAMREGARGKVLLVEANVRSPALAKALGFEVPSCFGEQIQRHHEDPELGWVVAEPLPGLQILAVDPRIEHPPLLDALAFSAAMDQLKRAGYQAILVDTPSVLGGVDVNMVADAVDGVVLTAIKMKSKKKSLRKAIEQLAPATILGVVVIDS